MVDEEGRIATRWLLSNDGWLWYSPRSTRKAIELDVELASNRYEGRNFDMTFRTFTIGRHPDADVRIDPNGRRAVSRTHAEVTVAEGLYFLIDRNSSYGTHVLGGSGWQEHRQGYVDASAKVRFGEYETSLADLLDHAMQRSPNVEVPYEPLSIRPRRNPGTGEVET